MEGYWDDPGYCVECGEQFEMVRPGKSQPNCECHLKCHACGGMYERFSDFEPHPEYPNFFGDYCRKCGPFGEQRCCTE